MPIFYGMQEVSDGRFLSLVTGADGDREIVVLHHTDCGAQTFNNEDFQEHLKCELGVDVSGQGFLTVSRRR